MSLTISPIGTLPIIPQPEPTPVVTQPVASSSSSDDSVSPAQSSLDEPHHGSRVMRTTADYTAIVRHELYHGAPPLIRNVPTYVIQGLAATTENPHSEHPFRDATIVIVAENVVERTLAGLIGSSWAGWGILAANLVAEPLQEALPSWEEVGQSLGSSDLFESRRADRWAQAKATADILALPHAAVHIISKLAQIGYDRLSGSTPHRSSSSSSMSSSSASSSSVSSSSSMSSSSASSSSVSSSSSMSSSSSVSSSSSLVSLPEADEVISLGKLLEERTWEIIRLRIVHAIVDGSTLVPPELQSVVSSALSSLSIRSELEESTERLPEMEPSRESKQSEGIPVKWTGVDVHVPLDNFNIKKIQIRTGVVIGQNGEYQTGISTTLGRPVKDLHVTASAEIMPDVRVGLTTSLRHPVKDLHVHASSSSGLGVSTSLRHPAKDVRATVPIVPLVAASIPLKKISDTSLVIGVPLVPALSVSVKVTTITKPLTKPITNGVRSIARHVFGRHRRRH